MPKRKWFVSALLVAVASVSFGAFVGEAHADPVSRTERRVFLNNVQGNAAAGARTFTLYLGNNNNTKVGTAFHMLSLHFKFTFGTLGASAVGMTCSSSDDGGTTLFTMQDCEMSSGACTSNDASWSKLTESGDKKWVWRVDMTGMTFASCTVSFTGGVEEDLLTVSGYVNTK